MTDEVRYAVEFAERAEAGTLEPTVVGVIRIAFGVLARTVREQAQEIERLKAELRTIGEIVGPVPGDDGGNTMSGVVALKMEHVTQERERLNRVIANCEAEIDKQMKLAIARGVEADNLRATVKGGPCDECKHVILDYCGSVTNASCRRTLKTDGVHIVVSYAPCAWLGNGCWAWEAKQ